MIQKINISVEIIDSNGNLTEINFPLLPKVFYLTSRSIEAFRDECRIDQHTTKLIDLMSYVKQFELEMDNNRYLAEKYQRLSDFLSGDAFKLYQQTFWIIGLFINLIVIGYYEVIQGELKIADPKIEALVYILSMMKLVACFVILSCWFMFRYQSLREIEREQFIIQRPEDNPNTFVNWFKINIVNTIFLRKACMAFILHGLFVI